MRVLLVIAAVALQGTAAADRVPAQGSARVEVREAVANLLAERYVFPDRAREYAALLRDRAIAERLDREPSDELFARSMLGVLTGHAPDGHLNLFPPRHPRAQEVHRGVVGIVPTREGTEERAARDRRANHHFTADKPY
jgi:hypothetical protein